MSEGSPRATGSVGLGAALILIMAAAPLVQHSVPALAPHLVGAFDISLLQLGLYSTLLFGASAILAPAMGRFSDALSTRALVLVLFTCGVVAATMVATASRYEMILVSALVTSIPMSLAHPLTNQLLVLNASGRRRSVLLAVKHSGVKVAQSAAGLVMAPLAAVFGWRAAFSLPILLSASGALFVPRLTGRLISPPSPKQGSVGATRLPRSIRWLTTYSILMALSQASVSTYLAIYAFDELGFDVTIAGVLTGILGLMGVVSRIAWGIWVHSTGASIWPLQMMAVGCLLATGCVLVSPFAGAPLLWFAAIALGVTMAIWNLAVSIVIFSVAPTQTGRATGHVYFGFALGMMGGPLLFGWLVEALDGYATAWSFVMLWQFLALIATVPLWRSIRWRREK